MISERVVRLITEYFDECATSKSQATLVGILGYVDYRNKTLPMVEEVNEALRQRPSALTYVPLVSVEQMRQADRQYRKRFSQALKKLRSLDA